LAELERAASPEDGQVDILNSLAITYKMTGDNKSALQRYNVALEVLVAVKMRHHIF